MPTNAISAEPLAIGNKVRLCANHEAESLLVIIAVQFRVYNSRDDQNGGYRCVANFEQVLALTFSGHCERGDTEWKIQIPQEKAFSAKKGE